MHQIPEISNGLYQQCREALGGKRNLWDHLRGATRLMIFPDWQMLLMRVLEALRVLETAHYRQASLFEGAL